MMTQRNKLLKRCLALILAVCTVFGAASTGASARSIGGGVGTDVNKNLYTITQKYVDRDGNPLKNNAGSLIADTTDSFIGVGKTHTYTPPSFTKLVYVGYYVAPATIANTQTGNPSVSSRLDGKDAVNGKGYFTIYHVYAPDDNENEIPDPDERYDIKERYVDESGTEVKTPELKKVVGVYYTGTHPAITDYTYQGYFYSADKGGYAGGSLVAPLTGDPTNMLLHADDGKNTYTVTYVYKTDRVKISINYHANAADAMGNMDTDYAYKNVPVKLSPNLFVRPGYLFKGWSTTAAGAAVHMNAATVTLTGNTDLYAVWEFDPSQHTVLSFDKNAPDAVGGMANQNVLKGKAVAIEPNQFSREGYLFDGWSLTPTGGIDYTNNAQITISDPTTLYAVWKRNPDAWVKISFDKNADDATGTMDDQYMLKNKATALDANGFARDGFVFKGWAETAAGAAAFTDTQVISLNADKILYAVWEEDPNAFVTITYNAGNSLAGSMDTQKVRKNTTTKLLKNQFTHDEQHVFLGWSLTDGGVIAYTDTETITVVDTMDLYAVWGTPALDGEMIGPDAPVSVSDEVNYSLSFWNEDILHATPFYRSTLVVKMSEYLDKLENLVVKKNGAVIPNGDLSYSYNFASKELTLSIGTINPGDRYDISFSGVVTPAGHGQHLYTQWDLFGNDQPPVGRMLFSVGADSSSRSIGGSVVTEIAD